MLKTFIQLLCSSLFLYSCINKSENLHVYQSLNDNLTHSNNAINNSTQDVFMAMEQKLRDPMTRTKAEIWHPKMQQIRKASKETFDYINSLKNELMLAADLNATADKKDYRMSDYGAVNKVFFSNKRGEQLYNRLIAYIDTIRAIDPKLSSTFPTTVLTSSIIDTAIKSTSQFSDNYFRNVPAIAAMAILSRFQNGLRIIENQTSGFCNEQVWPMICGYKVTSALAGISSSVVQKGKEIQLTAGIGEFTTSGNPEIIIDGKRIELNERGYVDYKFTTPTKPGNYSKRVQFHYTDAEGNKMTLEKVFEYTVVNN
jgi:hypothetical protein